jgi:hypothetical protein
MRSTRVVIGLTVALAVCVPGQAKSGAACAPLLTFKQVRFGEAQDQLRKWTGTLSVDASRCQRTSGDFEMKFVRGKEMGLDVLFAQKFQWKPGPIEVSLDFWWDENVEDYWISDIPSCGCPD